MREEELVLDVIGQLDEVAEVHHSGFACLDGLQDVQGARAVLQQANDLQVHHGEILGVHAPHEAQAEILAVRLGDLQVVPQAHDPGRRKERRKETQTACEQRKGADR